MSKNLTKICRGTLQNTPPADQQTLNPKPSTELTELPELTKLIELTEPTELTEITELTEPTELTLNPKP